MTRLDGAARRYFPSIQLVGVWLVYGLVRAALRVGADGWRFVAPATTASLAHAATWAFLTPLIAHTTRRARRAKVGLVRAVAVHVALGTVCTVLSTAAYHYGMIWTLGRTPWGFWQTFARTADVNLVTYVIAISVILMWDYRRAALAADLRSQALQSELSQARFQFLQRQLQPHFLFNALNAIAELTHEVPRVAATMLAHLRSLLSSALRASSRTQVPLREELALLEPYLAIQRTRFSDWLRIEQRIEPETLDVLVPPLVLQPLVENAIQHGLAARDVPGVLAIESRAWRGRLQLRVCDNGAGTGHGHARGLGIGLRNTEERLRSLYGSDFRLAVRDETGGGVTAEIDFPLRERLPAAAPAPPASLETAGDSEPPWPRLTKPRLVALVGMWLGLWAFWLAQTLFIVATSPSPVPMALSAILGDLVTALVWIPLTPLIARMADGIRTARWSWPPRIVVHLVLSLVVAYGHMEFVRLVTGYGEPAPWYVPINSSVLTMDVLLYAAIVAWVHGRDVAAWYRARAEDALSLTNALYDARWRALSASLEAELLVRVLDRVIATVPDDPRRAEEMIEQLADAVRQTLEATTVAHLPLQRELEVAQTVADLHRLVGEGDIRFVSDAPDDMQTLVPSGVVRNLIRLADHGALHGRTRVLDLHVRLTPASQRHRALELTASEPVWSAPEPAGARVPDGSPSVAHAAIEIRDPSHAVALFDAGGTDAHDVPDERVALVPA
jgi:two-component system, LytTR family, sensor kinase